MNGDDFRFVAGLLLQRSGLALGPDKGYLIDSRLTPVARANGFGDVAGLVRVLRCNPEPRLVEAVVDAMTTNESFFFRDGRPFARFADHVLPELLKARRAQRTLSIWCAAASTGQEPYSLAMCLADRARELEGWKVDLLATDISPTALERAKAGIYSTFEVQRGLPPDRLVRCFDRIGDSYTIKPAIKRWVRFQRNNLLELRPGFGRFDIVFCRNVLIYFDAATKRRVLDTMAGFIPADGVLVLGGTETLLGVCDRFEGVPGERGLYRPLARHASAAGAPARATA
ncbi:MAG: protein-glutamate O-methyltransferase [Pseudomonadota bacterium]